MMPPTERMADAFEAARRKFWDELDLTGVDGVSLGELSRRANLAGLTGALLERQPEPAPEVDDELIDLAVGPMWRLLPSEVQDGREPDDVRDWARTVLHVGAIDRGLTESRLRAQLDIAVNARIRAFALARRMQEALLAVRDPDPCSYDHNGSCQAHGQGADEVCPQKLVGDALDPAGPGHPGHIYLSTGCLHGDHAYCQNDTGAAGVKVPGVCKFCRAPCICACHAVAP